MAKITDRAKATRIQDFKKFADLELISITGVGGGTPFELLFIQIGCNIKFP